MPIKITRRAMPINIWYVATFLSLLSTLRIWPKHIDNKLGTYLGWACIRLRERGGNRL